MNTRPIFQLFVTVILSFAILVNFTLAQDTRGQGTVTSTATLRQASTTQSAALVSLPEGTSVTILAEEQGQSITLRGVTNSVWYRIRTADGTTGYIWSGLIEIVEGPSTQTATPRPNIAQLSGIWIETTMTFKVTVPSSTQGFPSSITGNKLTPEQRKLLEKMALGQAIIAREKAENELGINQFTIEAIPQTSRAVSMDTARYIVTVVISKDDVQRCSYTGGSTLIRSRIDAEITIVDAASGDVIGQRTLTGETPSPCPSVYRKVALYGGIPTFDDFGQWVIGSLEAPVTPTPLPTPRAALAGVNATIDVDARSYSSGIKAPVWFYTVTFHEINGIAVNMTQVRLRIYAKNGKVFMFENGGFKRIWDSKRQAYSDLSLPGYGSGSYTNWVNSPNCTLCEARLELKFQGEDEHGHQIIAEANAILKRPS